MLKISVSFFNISSKFVQTFVPSDGTKASTAAIVASVVATTCQPGHSLSTMLSLLPANFVHQTCIAGLVKHLSPYTGRISEWISFALSLFPTKKWITARCSLRDDFNGNVAIFNVYKWRHSERHRNKTHSWYSELNSLQNVYFRFFIFGKLTEWRCFVTYLFIERPSYKELSVGA